MTDRIKLPDSIERVLQRTQRAWFATGLVESLLLLIVSLAAMTLAGFIADNVVALPPLVRFICLSAAIVFGVRLLARAAARRLSRIGAALRVEKENPDLDHRLINALLLSSDPQASSSPVVHRLVADAGKAADPTAMKPPRTGGRIRFYGILSLGLVILLSFYGFLLPRHFRNAASRFSRPFGSVLPLTRFNLHIAPGDVTVIPGDSILVRAAPQGEAPSSATLLVECKGCEEHMDMHYAGGEFVFTLNDVLEDFTYRVRAGDFRSPEFHVVVNEAPRAERIRRTLSFPEYTGLEQKVEEGSSGNVSAWKGTQVLWEVLPKSSLASAALRFESGKELALESLGNGWWGARFQVDGNRVMKLVMIGEDGERDDAPSHYTVECKIDAGPSVRILDPGADKAVTAGKEIDLLIEAIDDVGLAQLRLLSREPESVLSQWNFEPGTTRIHTTGRVRVPSSTSSLRIHAIAVDRKGQETASGTVRFLVLAPGLGEEETKAHLQSLFARLSRLLELQKQALQDTLALKELGKAREVQQRILNGALKLSKGWLPLTTDEDRWKQRFQRLAEGPLTESAKARHLNIDELMVLQEEVIVGLRALLYEVDQDLTALGGGLLAGEEQERLLRERETAARASETMEVLKAFAVDQEEVISATRRLLDQGPAADEETLLKLAKTEEEWGKAISSLAEDYHKLNPQDFSDSTLAEELVEIFSEVELAADALEKEAIEIAVTREETAMELAEALTADLERWLDDVPDHIKWKMEDPLEDYDVPLVDLPEELEDIVGELIDSEQSLTEAVEDLTSGWLDSMDEGAGWTTMDGPISNMSARGVTGNLLPNEQEVGGRSGEGRSGRSHGQMVEETAQGKGGRQTPTRSTPDPYEAGSVEDTSRDAEGGSTGGGKLSGTGSDGLRGQPPPEATAIMDRLAGRQAEIRQKGEKVLMEYRKLNYHPADLEQALETMQRMERALKNRKPLDYGEVLRTILGNLETAQREAGALKQFHRERSRPLPEALRSALRSAFDDPLPEEYEDLISRYYRSLAEKGGER